MTVGHVEGTTSATARLTAGVGHSELSDARSAGAEATAAAVRQLDTAPALILVYAARRYDSVELLAGVRAEAKDADVVGATADEFFADGATWLSENAAVAVLALSAGPYRFGIGSTADTETDQARVAAAVTRQARENAGGGLGYAAALVLGDDNNSRHQQLLTGVHQVAGATVPIVGGGFGDYRLLDRTALYHNDRILESGMVVVWIESPHPLTVSVAHGWEPSGLPQLITAADDTYVEEIEGRPALEVLHDQFPELARGSGAVADPSAAMPWAFGLGLIEPDGAQFIRGFVIEDGERMRMHTALPAFAAIQFVRASPTSLLGINEKVVREAVGDREVGAVIVFSCVGRLRVLGDRAAEEAEGVHDAAGVPSLGMFSYGEFARVSGITGYHNSTVVALAL
ncbi:FIST signal transduction protein [Skermania piniformis]|uniref:FIST C-terminal domain-containing protein n=2 Tax=Skermania pinensis TaxID=39122 RepID=A0ABX8S6Q4_9ACTN|nr:FIST N-terminal domain-containing protein [Skermania piniformis]QXQ12679.1 FIST C-terminal domain-containing protein [Skermania piniformis]